MLGGCATLAQPSERVQDGLDNPDLSIRPCLVGLLPWLSPVSVCKTAWTKGNKDVKYQ